MSAIRPVSWYRPLYVACIVFMSAETVRSARGVSDHHFWLGAIEALAALGLLSRRTRLTGFVTLLVVYALVAGVNIASGHMPAYLVLYAASAVLIVQLDRASA